MSMDHSQHKYPLTVKGCAICAAEYRAEAILIHAIKLAEEDGEDFEALPELEKDYFVGKATTAYDEHEIFDNKGECVNCRMKVVAVEEGELLRRAL